MDLGEEFELSSMALAMSSLLDPSGSTNLFNWLPYCRKSSLAKTKLLLRVGLASSFLDL